MHVSTSFLLTLVASVVGTAIHAKDARAATSTSASAMPSVTLDYCTVAAAGGNSTIGYYKYQNIRYAAVPTGTLRFAQPQWPAKETAVNTGSLAASNVACSSEEDCLYMDVWAPANSKGKKLPVMVWTYGGGFTGGSKNENTPEGLFNLTKEFIFVSYNYRLGMTGIANGPSLLHEGGTSNVGLWDVQHAFQWTKKYISQFGGDPNEITAVGFSAGASQTIFQMTRFAGRAPQLFNRAYVMSPGFVPGAGHQHAEQFWQNVSTTVGCDGGHIACMRSVNFTTLIAAGNNITSTYDYQFQPRVDGDFVADTYEAQLYQKRFNFTGPLVITHELHEDNSAATSGVNTTADVSTYLRIFFPSITDDVIEQALDLYPESDYSSPGLRFADMRQSFDLTAHNLALTQAMSNKTWNALVALGGATHGTDQSYYWYSTASLTTTSSSSDNSSTSTTGMSGSAPGAGTGPSSSTTNSTSTSNSTTAMGAGGAGMTSVNSTIAIAMQKYLLSFVLTGNPNTNWAGDKLHWPQYGSNATELVFNTTTYTATDNLANAKSLFWNKALWY